ncbi:hypothetical protein BJ742DRAFT_873891 [Cladochytrium replicatum]|nr:hypothetical protein BJ742DRAFT_873891 [Cladochytrium replicatum]
MEYDSLEESDAHYSGSENEEREINSSRSASMPKEIDLGLGGEPDEMAVVQQHWEQWWTLKAENVLGVPPVSCFAEAIGRVVFRWTRGHDRKREMRQPMNPLERLAAQAQSGSKLVLETKPQQTRKSLRAASKMDGRKAWWEPHVVQKAMGEESIPYVDGAGTALVCQSGISSLEAAESLGSTRTRATQMKILLDWGGNHETSYSILDVQRHGAGGYYLKAWEEWYKQTPGEDPDSFYYYGQGQRGDPAASTAPGDAAAPTSDARTFCQINNHAGWARMRRKVGKIIRLGRILSELEVWVQIYARVPSSLCWSFVLWW